MKINKPQLNKLTKIIPIKYLTLLFSISGVIFLYSLSMFQQPILLTSIQTLDEYEGKEVTLSGIILDYSTTNYGNQIIKIQCNSTELTVFSETPLSFHKGDMLQATGTIQEYKDNWELIISNPKTAKIKETWQNKTTTIKDIAEHPEDYINIPRNITGYIDLTYETLTYLKDSSGTYTLPLTTPTQSIPKIGSKVYLHATLSYDSTNARYILTDCNSIQEIIPASEEK